MPLCRRSFLATLAAVSLAPLAARAATGPRVVVTTGMIADAAQAVLGAEVTSLMGPGLDPHSYRQTRSDIAALAGADLVLYHGLYLEAQMEAFLLDLGRRKPVVAVAEALPHERLIGHPEYAGRFDPHVWMDPTLWAPVVDRIATALAEVAPDDGMAARAAAYRGQVLALDGYAREVLATVPEGARVLVTAHDAFSYFGRAYGWEVQGIQGISTDSEAGLARIGDLVDLLVARNVGAVFVESSVSDRTIRALVEGAAARGHAVVIGGELFSDAMGEAGSYEGTYPGMIDHNATTIARALGGRVPPRGMQGKLRAEA